MSSTAFHLFRAALFIVASFWRPRSMKPSLYRACFILVAINMRAQGLVYLDNQVNGTVISHVYLPLPGNPGLVQVGNGVNDYPPGATDWTGWTPVSGSGYSAQLFAAPGADMPVSSLSPGLPVTNFRTGVYAGFVVPVLVMLSSVPPDTPVATIQMRVWDNHAGTVTDWATALTQPAGTELLGMSPPINVAHIPSIGGLAPPLAGLQSFNLTYIPEPSSLGLAGLGAIALSIAWLMKKASERDLEQASVTRIWEM
jgi:hypothetical protein